MSKSEEIRPPRGTVAVIVRDGRLLVVRRSELVVAPGMLCFPGGGIEHGETEPAALIRELREELGVVVRPRQLVWRSTTAWGVEIAWWWAELSIAAELSPNLAEVESVHWFTPAELAARDDLLQSNREFLAAMRDGCFAVEGL